MLTLSDFKSYQDEMTALLQELVEIESPSREIAAVNRMGAAVTNHLEALGARISVDQQTTTGNHILGRWGPNEGKNGFLLLCHMDTVHPLGSIEKNPCRVVDGRLTGPGAVDMKAGIAICLTVIRVLRDRGQFPDAPLTALFTSDEETGSRTSRPLIERLARDARLVLCLEPCLEDGGLKVWRKGVGNFRITVRGRAAHAGGAHANGVNAIIELAHQVIKIQGLTDYERGTTLNVGVIRGGTTTNVVPEEAEARVDLRVMTPEEAERISRELHSLEPVLEGTSLSVYGGLNRPPMPFDERMARTFERARTIAADLGLDLKMGGTGGGSDANFVAPLGVPVLDGLGALGGGMHSHREYVQVQSLPERAALLAALLTKWG